MPRALRRSSTATSTTSLKHNVNVAAYPTLPLREQKLTALAEDLKDWALCHGIVIRPSGDSKSSDAAVVAPFTLLPSIFPGELFSEALAVQKDFNLLYANVAADFDFLKRSLTNVIATDGFTRRLFEILEKVHNESGDNLLLFNLMRSDYMIHNVEKVPDSEESVQEISDVSSKEKSEPQLSSPASAKQDEPAAVATTGAALTTEPTEQKAEEPEAAISDSMKEQQQAVDGEGIPATENNVVDEAAEAKPPPISSSISDNVSSTPAAAAEKAEEPQVEASAAGGTGRRGRPRKSGEKAKSEQQEVLVRPTKKAKVEDVRTVFLKQVEVNAIAASFAGLTSQVYSLHTMVLRSFFNFSDLQLRHILPPANNATRMLAQGLIAAWHEFGDPNAVLLVVVEEETRNIADQRLLEYLIAEEANWQIKILRKNLREIATEFHWDETAKSLTVYEPDFDDSASAFDAAGKVNHDEAKPVNGGGDHAADKIKFARAVGVVYYRAGYVPGHYPSELEWTARERLERSRAIKCPSIAFHLAGTKKVQMELTKPGVVEQFVKTKKAADAIRATFMPMYGFEDPEEAKKAIEDVRANPSKFVLKPQLEGGGNNSYGADILPRLDILSEEERKAFVLMERINPGQRKAQNYIVRAGGAGPPPLVETVSELGVFGYFLGTKFHVKANVADGYLLRTKPRGVDEGGIMAGAAALDTPCFC